MDNATTSISAVCAAVILMMHILHDLALQWFGDLKMCILSALLSQAK